MNCTVITTPTCSRCLILKKIAKEQGLEENIKFVPFDSEEGTAILDKLNEKGLSIGAGILLDSETLEIVSLQALKESITK